MEWMCFGGSMGRRLSEWIRQESTVKLLIEVDLGKL